MSYSAVRRDCDVLTMQAFLRLCGKRKGGRNSPAHFTRNDHAQQQNGVGFWHQESRRGAPSMDKLEHDRSR